MLQQETGEVKLSEDGSVEFETLTDDEEITIPPQDRDREVSELLGMLISMMNRLWKIHNEKTSYYLRSPCMGLARDRPVGSALR